MIKADRADELIKKFAKKRILVVGDLMLDKFVSGTVSRISPEAPVPVICVTAEKTLPGGAANVALNIQSLGGQAVVAGMIGKDAAAKELSKLLTGKGIATDGLIVHEKARTIVKMRIVAERQQVVRVDYEDAPDVVADAVPISKEKILQIMKTVSAVIIEDYGKGMVNQQVVDAILSAAQKAKIPVGLDPKDNSDLKIEGVTLATPNYKEARYAVNLPEVPLGKDPMNDSNLALTAELLMKKWKPETLIITLGPLGMYLITGKEKPRHIPTRAREVFDVCGAGDTVIASAMLGLVGGASFVEAASLANYAAGVVVGKVGTATCAPAELIEFML